MEKGIHFGLPSYYQTMFCKIDTDCLDTEIISKIAAAQKTNAEKNQRYWKLMSWLFIEQCLLIWSFTEKDICFERDIVAAANEYWEQTIVRMERKFSIHGRVSPNDWSEVSKIATLVSSDRIPGLSFEKFKGLLQKEFAFAKYRMTEFPQKEPEISSGFLFGGKPRPFFESSVPLDFDIRKKL